MTPRSRQLTLVSLIACSAGLFSGCSAFRSAVYDTDPNTASTLTADFDQRDLEKWANDAAQTLLAQTPAVTANKRPIYIDLGVKNGTSDHIDMRMLGNAIRVKLIQSGKVQFVNGAARDKLLTEQGYQLANCTVETKAKIGAQLGAGYMVTGYLGEISQKSGKQVRVNKQRDVYYQLTVDLTNLKTGLVEATALEKRMRRHNQPLIGW